MFCRFCGAAIIDETKCRECNLDVNLPHEEYEGRKMIYAAMRMKTPSITPRQAICYMEKSVGTAYCRSIRLMSKILKEANARKKEIRPQSEQKEDPDVTKIQLLKEIRDNMLELKKSIGSSSS